MHANERNSSGAQYMFKFFMDLRVGEVHCWKSSGMAHDRYGTMVQSMGTVNIGAKQ